MKVWSWQQAIQEAELESTTKLVLFNLSIYMNLRGQNCFPSTKTQATDCSLSERAICTHLDKAEIAGYIKTKVHGYSGQKWKRHEYYPTVPGGVLGFASDDSKGLEGYEAAERDALIGTEPDDIKVLKDVQSNLPENIPLKNIQKRILPKVKKQAGKKGEVLELPEWEKTHGPFTIVKIKDWVRDNELDPDKINIKIQYFRDTCLSKGYCYVDFAAAFRQWFTKEIPHLLHDAAAARRDEAQAVVKSLGNFVKREAKGNDL